MNNDLISRSELKKEIEELPITEELVDYDCGCATLTGVSQYLDRPDVLDLIDNAPTVSERPQGEWRIIADVYCKCPFCSNVEVKFSDYCPECGARLEGGAE